MTATRLLIALLLLSCAGAMLAQDLDQDWRWCRKCQGLFHAAGSGSNCPADAGEHDATVSGRYSVPRASAVHLGVEAWRRCDKCLALYLPVAGAPNVCPESGVHTTQTTAGTPVYKLSAQSPSSFKSEGGWQRCSRCSALFYRPNGASDCPAGGAHLGLGTSYSLIVDAAVDVGSGVMVGDDVGFPLPKAGEAQSTVVPPLKKPQCPAGRVLVSHHEFGTILYRALNEAGSATHQATIAPVANPGDYNLSGTADHDLITLANGDVYYITAAHSKKELPADQVPAWWNFSYRAGFGPGARSVMLAWRSTDCGNTFHPVPELEFDTATAGDRSCAFPAPLRSFQHVDDGGKYLAPRAAFASTEPASWRYCGFCGQLFSSDPAHPSVCPAGGAHKGGLQYRMLTAPLSGHEDSAGWKTCKHCGVLFSATGSSSACITRNAHDGSLSGGYHVITGTQPAVAGVEAGFRYCSKCGALVSGSVPGSCPRGGTHNRSGGVYQVTLQASTLAGQAEWRHCSRCRGLFFARAGHPDVCSDGGSHQATGTAYKLQETAPAAPIQAQGGWKWCRFCGALYFGDQPSRCPVTRPHEPVGGGSEYHLPLENASGASLPNLQQGWRRCAKCRALYFTAAGPTICPVGGAGEPPRFNMGGTDGQLAIADQDTNRILLVHRCVGHLPDSDAKTFELSEKKLNRTFIAQSENGAAWQILGVAPVNVWRTGIVRRTDGSFALVAGTSVVRVTKTAGGRSLFDLKPLTGVDTWKPDPPLPPQIKIDTGKWSHAVIARVPASDKVLVVVPDKIQQMFGYRIYFHDVATGNAVETSAVLPESGVAGDLAFHLQLIAPAGGPVLLYWNDLRRATGEVVVRGRFVTGDQQVTPPFVISRRNLSVRSYDAKAPAMPYWYGEYQTGGAHAASPGVWRYFPMWVEPDHTVHYGWIEIKF